MKYEKATTEVVKFKSIGFLTESVSSQEVADTIRDQAGVTKVDPRLKLVECETFSGDPIDLEDGSQIVFDAASDQPGVWYYSKV